MRHAFNFIITALLVIPPFSLADGDHHEWFAEEPLKHAIVHNRIAEVERLIKEGETVVKAPDKQTGPLDWAARSGHPEMIKFLLKNGAAPDLDHLVRPLWHIIHNNTGDIVPVENKVEIFKMLLATGVAESKAMADTLEWERVDSLLEKAKREKFNFSDPAESHLVEFEKMNLRFLPR